MVLLQWLALRMNLTTLAIRGSQGDGGVAEVQFTIHTHIAHTISARGTKEKSNVSV